MFQRHHSQKTKLASSSTDGKTKNEIDYIVTGKPNMVTYVRVINRMDIGSDQRMLMSNISLDTKAER